MKKVYWLTKILLTKDTQENINDCFNIEVDFKYKKKLDEFDNLLDFFQRHKDKSSCNDSLMSENILMDCNGRGLTPC